jgi:hypothetical protein
MDELIRALQTAPLREQLAILGAATVALALGFGFVGATIGAYFGGRIGARRALAAMRRELPSATASDQMDEVRNALDAIAVEVERISEGQRFTARLVADRVGQAPLPVHRREPGPITPH